MINIFQLTSKALVNLGDLESYSDTPKFVPRKLVTVLDFEVMLISAPFSISSAPSSSCTFLSQHPRPT